ncbi:hypothetical protein LXA43DRAFT_718446 [Ganoderma leucocontextum]|nr:hypothetical protein LXA43DRAFT_718446 [Ganoderma leucocontextum]
MNMTDSFVLSAATAVSADVLFRHMMFRQRSGQFLTRTSRPTCTTRHLKPPRLSELGSSGEHGLFKRDISTVSCTGCVSIRPGSLVLEARLPVRCPEGSDSSACVLTSRAIARTMHLIWSLVLLVCAAAHPLPRGLLSTLAGEELGGPANVPEIPLSLALICVSGGNCDELNGLSRGVSPMVRDELANRAVALQAPPASTTLQVIIPTTPSRTSLSPLPTGTQLPSHTQPGSTAEEQSSIPVTPHAPSEASSPVATATATGDSDGVDSDSGSDPSTSTPTSTDSSSPSELATILGGPRFPGHSRTLREVETRVRRARQALDFSGP